MKKLKQKDMEDINRFHAHSPHARIIKQFLCWNFKEDDILIRSQIDASGNKSVDIVSNVCKVPKKFRVIHIDELGIPWVKQLCVRGGMGNKLYCLINYAINYSWEVDPEQIDAIILGYKYDPRSEYKNMRSSTPQYGVSRQKQES